MNILVLLVALLATCGLVASVAAAGQAALAWVVDRCGWRPAIPSTWMRAMRSLSLSPRLVQVSPPSVVL